MGSRVLVLLGLSIAFALLITSEVAARDLAETTPKTTGGTSLYEEGYGYFPSNPPSGNCYYTCYGSCCSAAEAKALEVKATTTQVKPHN